MENLHNIIIQNATTEDVDSISSLEKECFSDAWSKESFYSCFENPFYKVVVAKDYGKLIGYAIIKCIYEDGELLRVAVSVQYRRQSVSYNLLTRIFEMAGCNGVEKIFLDVRESNDAAILLYEKMGFRRYEMTDGFYSNPVEASVKMMLEL